MRECEQSREILELLRAKGLKLSVAESCTGGLLANAFVCIEGASDVFLGGLLCYSCEAKVQIAGVSKESAFDNYAVNEPCAKEFAQGSLDKFNADFALSTTGFAEDSKEMYFAISSKIETKIETKCFKNVFFGSRNEIRQAQVEFVLSKFLEFLRGYLANNLV